MAKIIISLSRLNYYHSEKLLVTEVIIIKINFIPSQANYFQDFLIQILIHCFLIKFDLLITILIQINGRNLNFAHSLELILIVIFFSSFFKLK